MRPLFPFWGNQPKDPSKHPYRRAAHHRSFTKYRDRHLIGDDQPASVTLLTQPTHTFGAGYLGFRATSKYLSDRSSLGKYFIPDEAYKLVRNLEQRLPAFRIPIRASQLGDLLSPFVSDKALVWKYGGSELIGPGGEWRKQFHELRDSLRGAYDKGKLAPDLHQKAGTWGQVEALIGSQGLSFEKQGRVYGRVVMPGRAPGQSSLSVLEDAFLMERPSTKSGAFAALWEPSQRQTAIYRALDKDHWLLRGIKSFTGGLSRANESRIRRLGGFAKNYFGDYFSEYVRAMNRFLQEPVPFIDQILARPSEESARSFMRPGADAVSSDILETTFNRYMPKKYAPARQTIPFGRLQFAWMRPYVSSEKWTSTPLRMMSAISAKGAFYIKGIPTAYMLLDNLRRKFDWTGSAAVSTPLFAGIGLGLGSLIWSNKISPKTRLVGSLSKLGMTKTQLGGMVLGGLVGALPTFDKGFGSGVGSLYSRFRMASSKLWSTIGAHDSLERQEDLFPGMTSPVTGAGFMMLGGISGYLGREMGTVKSMLQLDKKFLSGVRQEFQDVMEFVSSAENQIFTEGVEIGTGREIGLSREARQKFGSLFEKYAVRDTPGYISATNEAREILERGFKGTVPRSEAGLLASLVKARVDVGGPDLGDLGQRMATEESREQLAGRLYTQAEHFGETLLEGRLDSRIIDGEMSRSRAFLEKAKAGIKRPKPGFIRGALRGGAAFAGVSMVGALAAGPLGGNFSLGDLVPGWLIKLTGGGMRPGETEEVFTGRKEVAIRKARWWALGRCFGADTAIEVEPGKFKSAEEITLQDTLVGADGQVHKIKNIWKRRHEGTILKVSTRIGGGLQFRVTDNHIIPAIIAKPYSNQFKDKRQALAEGEQWVEAGELKKGDYLRVAIPALEEAEQVLDLRELNLGCHLVDLGDGTFAPGQRNRYTKGLQKTRGTRLPGKIPVDVEFGYALGVFLAEGSLSFKDTTGAPTVIETTHHEGESFIYERLVRFFESFGVTAKVEGRKGKSARLRACSSLMASVFFSLIYDNVKGSCRKAKRIPPVIFQAPLPVKEAFLEGWFDGDGHTDGRPNCISTCSDRLKDECRTLLLSLGYLPRVIEPEINSFYRAPSGEYTGHFIRHKIFWNRNSRSGNPQYFWREEGTSYVAVKKVAREEYDGWVYDFEIDHEDHLLSCAGVLVHNSPFEGGKIQFHRKHRAVLMQSDAEDNAFYGSYQEKMDYEPILHPMKYLFSDSFKYHREIRLSQIAPTPLTARPLADVPLFGEVLANTVGQVIKPQKAIRANEWMTGSTSFLGGMFSRQSVQAPPGHSDWGSMRNAPAVTELGGSNKFQALLPGSLSHTGRQTFEKMSEQAGLRGFMLSTFLEDFTGYKSRTYKPVVESAETIFSPRAKFWGLNIGDPGISEALRRYLTRDRNTYYNPLKNQQPSWMPGTESGYYKDFQHGNPYSMIPEGHLRLPGPGLETLYPELKEYHPEQYPLAWQYKVLSGAAYGSKEWKFAKQKVIHALQAGTLTESDKSLVAETNRQLKDRSLKRVFRNYQFDEEKLKPVELTISAVYEDGTFSAVELGKRQLKLGGVNTSMAALTRQVMAQQNLASVEDAEQIARERQAEIVSAIRSRLEPGAKIQAHVPHSQTDLYSTQTSEVYIPGLASTVRGMGAEVDKDSDFRGQVTYNKAQRGLGRAWELFTHKLVDLPITPALALNQLLPFQPQSKFIQRLTPAELYARTQVYGRDIQMWQRYKEDFLDTALYETTAKLVGDFVPRKVAYRRAMMEYFDKVTWLKSFVLEQAAKSKGNAAAVQFYSEKRKQTIFGADPYKGFANVWRALPKSERDFYRDFIKETDDDEREKILALVPEHLKHIYIAQWQNKDIKALANKIEAGVASGKEKKDLFALYNMRRVQGMNWSPELQREYDTEIRGRKGRTEYSDWMRLKMLSEYFQHFKLPEKNWVGFCLPGDQMIVTVTGLKEASQIKIGDEILSEGKAWEIQEVYTREVDEEIVSLETESCSFLRMKATRNHMIKVVSLDECQYMAVRGYGDTTNTSCVPRVHSKCKGCKHLSYNEKKPYYKRITDVRPGKDFLVLPLLPETDSDFVLDLSSIGMHNVVEEEGRIRVRQGTRKGRFNRLFSITEEFCWLLGYYTAEGWLQRKKGEIYRTSFTRHENEVDFGTRVTEIVKQLGLSARTHSRRGSKGIDVNVGSKILGNIIYHFVKGMAKGGSKHLADLSFLRSRVHSLAFLEGLFSGDGSKERSRTRLGTSSLVLAQQVIHLLLVSGIPGSLTRVKDQYGNFQYRVSFSASEKSPESKLLHQRIINHTDLVQSLTSRQDRRIFRLKDFMAIGVKEVMQEHHSGLVYDFCVEGIHRYESVFGTYHNSPLTDLQDVQLKVAQGEGLDIHDFGLWESREVTLDAKPYVGEAAGEVQDWEAGAGGMTRAQFEAKIRRMVGAAGGMISVTPLPAWANSKVVMTGQDNQAHEAKRIMNGYGVV